MTVFQFIIICLADWRLSSLFANEDGPFSIFKRFRKLCDYLCSNNEIMKLSEVNEGLKCEWCNSIWFSVLTIIFYQLIYKSLTVFEMFVYPLAISTVVIFLKYVRERLEGAKNENESKSNQWDNPFDN